jgi:hypothetical protein
MRIANAKHRIDRLGNPCIDLPPNYLDEFVKHNGHPPVDWSQAVDRISDNFMVHYEDFGGSGIFRLIVDKGFITPAVTHGTRRVNIPNSYW